MPPHVWKQDQAQQQCSAEGFSRLQQISTCAVTTKKDQRVAVWSTNLWVRLQIRTKRTRGHEYRCWLWFARKFSTRTNDPIFLQAASNCIPSYCSSQTDQVNMTGIQMLYFWPHADWRVIPSNKNTAHQVQHQYESAHTAWVVIQGVITRQFTTPNKRDLKISTNNNKVASSRTRETEHRPSLVNRSTGFLWSTLESTTSDRKSSVAKIDDGPHFWEKDRTFTRSTRPVVQTVSENWDKRKRATAV